MESGLVEEENRSSDEEEYSSEDSSLVEYSSDDEGSDDYQSGGYHAVQIGDAFKQGRYVVQGKIGWGHFSTVWLAVDIHLSRYVALKVQKSAQNYTEAATDEIAILQQIAEGDPDDKNCVVKLLDHFKHSGPNGEHVCLVFEYLGDNLLTLMKYSDRGLPIPMVKEICFHILVGLDYLHRQLSIIHTDLKPENIVLRSMINPAKHPRNSDAPLIIPTDMGKGVAAQGSVQKESLTEDETSGSSSTGKINAEPESVTDCLHTTNGLTQVDGTEGSGKESEGNKRKSRSGKKKLLASADLRCKLVDFGNACWTYKQFTDEIQTRQYRCPEVILGSKYSTSADLWSFACICFELATGDKLFDPRSRDNHDRDEDHIALMMSLLGMMPREIALGGRYSRDVFNRHGDLRNIRRLGFADLRKALHENYDLSEQDAKDMSEFLLPILDFVPEKRPSAAHCLLHPWINSGPRLSVSSLPAEHIKTEESAGSETNKRENDEREVMEVGFGNISINSDSTTATTAKDSPAKSAF